MSKIIVVTNLRREKLYINVDHIITMIPRSESPPETEIRHTSHTEFTEESPEIIAIAMCMDESIVEVDKKLMELVKQWKDCSYGLTFNDWKKRLDGEKKI